MSHSQIVKTVAPFGMISLMSQEDYEDVFRKMYANEYFTNHGPLAKTFESQLENFLETENVVTVGNESLALLIAMLGMDIKGEIVVPAFRSATVVEAAAWLRIQTHPCDVDVSTHQVSIETLTRTLTEKTEAVVLIETWGNRCDASVVDFLCQRNLKVIIVAFDSWASQKDKRFVYDSKIKPENVVTVFSFGPEQMLSTLQGGAIATRRNDLAHRFRNIRSSYGVREPRQVKATCNGRFSEFQAGVGIRNLDYVAQHLVHNREIASAYSFTLKRCASVGVYKFGFTDTHNGQYFPIMINSDFPLTPVQLKGKLQSFGFETSTNTHSLPRNLPATTEINATAELLNSRILLLPVNKRINSELATQIAEKIVSFG